MASDDLDKIERLHALRQQGFLTDEEFAKEKRKLLAGSGEATAPEVPQVPLAAPSEATSSNEAYFDESYSRHPNRRVLWTALGVAAVMIVAVLAYLLTASQGGQTAPSEQMTASDVQTIADVPAAAATSMLAQVIESDFKGQDEIPHCTLSNAEDVAIFRSAIMMDGSRAAIIKRDGKVAVLTLAGAPNRFSGENGNLSAVVDYDKGAVRSVGEDEIKFDGKLTVTANGTSEAQPIHATCYGSHFDEGWAGRPVATNDTQAGTDGDAMASIWKDGQGVSGTCYAKVGNSVYMDGPCSGLGHGGSLFVTAEADGCSFDVTLKGQRAAGSLFAYRNTCGDLEADVAVGPFERQGECWSAPNARFCLRAD